MISSSLSPAMRADVEGMAGVVAVDAQLAELRAEGVDHELACEALAGAGEE
jgi:hypothetical protein